MGDAARARFSTTFASTDKLQLAGTGSTVVAMVQFFAKGTASEVAVDFSLALAVAAHDNSSRHMGEAYAIVCLIHLLPALAAATGEFFLQITIGNTQYLHVQLELSYFFRGDRHRNIIHAAQQRCKIISLAPAVASQSTELSQIIFCYKKTEQPLTPKISQRFNGKPEYVCQDNGSFLKASHKLGRLRSRKDRYEYTGF